MYFFAFIKFYKLSRNLQWFYIKISTLFNHNIIYNLIKDHEMVFTLGCESIFPTCPTRNQCSTFYISSMTHVHSSNLPKRYIPANFDPRCRIDSSKN